MVAPMRRLTANPRTRMTAMKRTRIVTIALVMAVSTRTLVSEMTSKMPL